jgi:pimeloyl-ACP methyl ester carboxylesterase
MQAMSGTPIVLVHGFWHGAWCWTEVIANLADRGRTAVAVDLAGHGLDSRRAASSWARPFDPAAFATEVSPSASVTMDHAAETLRGQLLQIAGGSPCLLVVHSMGGPVVSAVAERWPDLVGGLVYLAAFMPASGVPGISYALGPDNAGSLVAPEFIADPAVVGALRLDTGNASRHAALRAAFYGGVEPHVADAAIALMTQDAPAALAGTPVDLTQGRWGSIPRTYIRCTDDFAVRPALQQRFIAEADAAYPKNRTHVVELPSAHSPFLSMPAELAGVLVDAGERMHRHRKHP